MVAPSFTGEERTDVVLPIASVDEVEFTTTSNVVTDDEGHGHPGEEHEVTRTITRITTEDGHEGYCFGDLGDAGELIEGILVGRDALDREAVWQKLVRSQRVNTRLLHEEIIAAVDLALWDLVGRYTGLPVYKLLGAARERVSDPDGEYEATALDLRMLADLADYHAAKTRAAVELAAYRETDDVAALEAAYGHAEEMVDRWEALSERGEGTYRGDLVFAMGPAAADEGNWSDRLVELESDLDALRERLRAEGVAPSDVDPASGVTVVSDADGRGTPFDPPTVEASVPEAAAAGEAVRVSVRTGGLAGVDDLTLHYRHADQTEGAFRTAEMTHRDGAFHASVPANYVTPEWDLLVYVSGKDRAGDPVLHPGIYHAEEPEPYYVVDVEE